ncbi:MAG: hypothetical protein KDA83_14570 [Planctomycetales bacterium]|nr:hypothetical protein [Planctomycetales bacterium]
MVSHLTGSLLLAFHLLSVNVAMIAPLLMILIEFRAWRGDPAARELLPKVGLLATKTLLLGGLIGFLHGWLLWNDDYQALILATGSRWVFTIAEFGFSFVLVLAVWIFAARASRKLIERPASRPSWGFWIRGLLLFAAGTNLIYHFPVFFEIISVLRQQPIPDEPLTSAEFRALIAHPTVVSRTLHVVLAAIATTGAMVAWMAQRRFNKTEGSLRQAWHRWYRRGLHAVLGATSLQFFVGFWVALQLPRSKANTLTGGSDEALIVIGLAAVAITALLHAAIRGILEREKATYGTATALWLIGAVYSMSWISLLTR